MSRIAGRLVLAACAIGYAGVAHAGSYVFTDVTIGSDALILNGVNDAGQVVGIDTTQQRGFIWSNGVATLFPAPRGTSLLNVVAVGRAGVVLGEDFANPTVGVFTYDPATGRYQQPSVPKTSGLYPLGFNGHGTIVGNATIRRDRHTHGFYIAAGQGHLIDYPGATDTSFDSVSASGIASGNFFVNGMSSGFLYDTVAGRFTDVITIPNTLFGAGVDWVSSHGVALGRVTIAGMPPLTEPFVYSHGRYDVAPDPGASFLRILTSGALFDLEDDNADYLPIVKAHSGGVTFVSYPGAYSTNVFDVSPRGNFVGKASIIVNQREQDPLFVAICSADQVPCYKP